MDQRHGHNFPHGRSHAVDSTNDQNGTTRRAFKIVGDRHVDRGGSRARMAWISWRAGSPLMSGIRKYDVAAELMRLTKKGKGAPVVRMP